MKILIVTLGSIGDILPFIVVGTALQRRGHNVIFASNAGYEALVRSSGFQFHAMWDRTRSQPTLDDVLLPDPEEAWRRVECEMFAVAETAEFNFIEGEFAAGACTILASWSSRGARRAHQTLGVPLCIAYLSPGALAVAPTIGGDANREVLRLGFFPEWYCHRQSSWPPVELTGFPMFKDHLIPALPPELERFLSGGSPPVVITPGSFARGAENFLLESLDACTSRGLRAVVLTPYSNQVPVPLPDSAIYFKYVALQRLLSRSALLVCHGGIGTVAQALKAGIPQLVVPAFFDQADNACRLEALGTGAALQPRAYNARSAAAGMQNLLSSEAVRLNCIRVREKFLGVSPVELICAWIEKAA